MKKALCLLLCLTLALGMGITATADGDSTIVLTGAKLLSADYNGETLDVLVRDGYIVAVGENLTGDMVIDLTGYTLMPGMIDSHVHIASSSGYGIDLLAQFCEQGITSVREEGMLSTGDEAEFLSLIKDANENPANAYLVSCGKYLDVAGGYGMGPTGNMGVTITNAEDAVAEIEHKVELGYSQVKVGINSDDNRMTAEEFTAIIETAHENGLPVAAHVNYTKYLQELVSYGIDESAHTPSDAMPEDLFAEMAENDVAMNTSGAEEYEDIKIANLKGFYEAGGTITVGTDKMRNYDTAMESLVSELVVLSKAGLSVQEVIACATRNNAAALGIDDTGDLAPGMQADLIAVKGDIDASFSALTEVSFVMNNGVIIRADDAISVQAAASAADTDFAALTVKAGETYLVEETSILTRLTIEEGGNLEAPEGCSITLTVNGVETGQALIETTGTESAFVAGEWSGNVVLTITERTATDYQGLSFPIRQAIYLDEDGLVPNKSVTAAVVGDAASLRDITITSTGENFNGIYAAGGEHTVSNATICLTGNGRSDMVGEGAAIYADGASTRLVVEDSLVFNRGVVRTAAIANNGASLIVKNSTLIAQDGVLPEDYVPSADLGQMRGGFPIGGSIGNCRATNLLGDGTKATYINSLISAEGWGVLSTDGCTEPFLTGINSVIRITGDDIGGYGAYAIGNVTHRYLGCQFQVDYDIVSIKGGYVTLGDSTAEAVAALNEELGLRLTEEELAALPEQNTVVNSKRFGFVASGSGEINIGGNTQIHTGEAFFLNMAQQSCTLNVDGSEGAQIWSDNGIIVQLQDSDNPGPSGSPYTQPTEAPVADASFDPADVGSAAVNNFRNIEITGDFYNTMGYTKTTGMLNLALNFDNATVTGIMSSASATHLQDELYINAEDYKLFGVLNIAPCETVNNGVIVSLCGNSVWNVTGDSYLSSLAVEAGSVINGTVTVNGTPVDTSAGGSWTGNILVTA